MNLVLNDLCCYIPLCKKGNSDAVFNRSGCFPAKLLNSHATLIRRTKQLRVNVSESQRDQNHGQKNRFDSFLIQVKMQLLKVTFFCWGWGAGGSCKVYIERALTESHSIACLISLFQYLLGTDIKQNFKL